MCRLSPSSDHISFHHVLASTLFLIQHLGNSIKTTLKVKIRGIWFFPRNIQQFHRCYIAYVNMHTTELITYFCKEPRKSLLYIYIYFYMHRYEHKHHCKCRVGLTSQISLKPFDIGIG